MTPGPALAACGPTSGALARYAFLGGALAFAGPPIYIHAPSLYAAEYGLGLAAIGGLLLAVRALDFLQDPLLGWWFGRTGIAKRQLAAGFGALLALGMLGLFWPDAPGGPALRFTLGLAVVFTGFSALQILFYANGVALAGGADSLHSRIAGWREAGVLTGITAACILPELLRPLAGAQLAYGLFALAFAVLLATALWTNRAQWTQPPKQAAAVRTDPGALLTAVQDRTIRQLLAIGLLNALPSGLTATLFLFFVRDRLGAPDHVGPTLVVFFLAAAVAAPLWAKAAGLVGAKRALAAGMAAAILVFIWATQLGSGDWLAFYLVAIGSGAAMGADMTLLPALLSRRLAALRQSGEAVFGLWGFVNKAALALAAGLALPALDAAGFVPGQANDASALTALTIAYAAAPCVLKALALLALLIVRVEEGPRP